MQIAGTLNGAGTVDNLAVFIHDNLILRANFHRITVAARKKRPRNRIAEFDDQKSIVGCLAEASIDCIATIRRTYLLTSDSGSFAITPIPIRIKESLY
jgi:hypothetical protein